MPRRQHTLLVYCRCFLTACATDEKWSIINTKSGQINYSMRPLGLSFVFVFLCFSGEARLIQLIYFFRRANSTCINIELSELTQLRPLSSSATQLRWCNSNSDLTPTQLRPKRCRLVTARRRGPISKPQRSSSSMGRRSNGLQGSSNAKLARRYGKQGVTSFSEFLLSSPLYTCNRVRNARSGEPTEPSPTGGPKSCTKKERALEDASRKAKEQEQRKGPGARYTGTACECVLNLELSYTCGKAYRCTCHRDTHRDGCG